LIQLILLLREQSHAHRPQPPAALDTGGDPRDDQRAGLDLPEELMQQFIEVWPAFEAMVRRIPRNLGREAEPAHSYRPSRLVRA
jgi:hypothetical protein